MNRDGRYMPGYYDQGNYPNRGRNATRPPRPRFDEARATNGGEGVGNPFQGNKNSPLQEGRGGSYSQNRGGGLYSHHRGQDDRPHGRGGYEPHGRGGFQSQNRGGGFHSYNRGPEGNLQERRGYEPHGRGGYQSQNRGGGFHSYNRGPEDQAQERGGGYEHPGRGGGYHSQNRAEYPSQEWGGGYQQRGRGGGHHSQNRRSQFHDNQQHYNPRRFIRRLPVLEEPKKEPPPYFEVDYGFNINKEGRSLFEAHANIPKFSEEDQEKDRMLCEDLYYILRNVAKQSHESLLAKYLERMAEKEEEPLIGDIDQLQDFIKTHQHVFETRPFDPYIRNRGYGHRRGIVYLSCIIMGKEASLLGASMEDIFDQASALPTHSYNIKWKDDFLYLSPIKTREDLVDFLEEHPQIFEITNKEGATFIRVTDEARRIPTMWNSTLTAFEAAKSEKFWEESRTFTFLGYVITTKDQFLQVAVARGPFNGREVYVLGHQVNKRTHAITEIFSPGTEVCVTARVAINYNDAFSAITIERVEREAATDHEYSVKETAMNMEDLLEYWKSTDALNNCIKQFDSVEPLLHTPQLDMKPIEEGESIEDRLAEKFL